MRRELKRADLATGMLFKGSLHFVIAEVQEMSISPVILSVVVQNYVSQKCVPVYGDCDLDFDTVLSWRYIIHILLCNGLTR
jgi:hypothetical protein